MNSHIKKLIHKYFSKKVYFWIFCALFIILLITRFYDLEGKNAFGYDQVDNAWAAKDIIVDGKLPLVGMQAKANTGFFIGPLYYYYLVPFYFLSNLDPIASGFAAGIASIITFFVVFYVSKKIFNEKIALIALSITVFSSHIIQLDRTQWPVNFMVPIAFLIFLSIYKILLGRFYYVFLLALFLGFSLHVHFTSIFYFLIFIIFVPFIPKKKEFSRYALLFFPIFVFLIFPIIMNLIYTNSANNATYYIGSNFHGFHLRRFLQIIGDGFIEFNSILNFPYSILLSLVSFGIYIYLLLKSNDKKLKLLVLLSVVWVLIPWLIFSTYSGEITGYYFGMTRVVAIFAISYIIYKLISITIYPYNFIVFLIFITYALYNLNIFFSTGPVGLKEWRRTVERRLYKGEKIEFSQGDPQSFLYYIHQRNKEK